MSEKKKHVKPVGSTGPIEICPAGVVRHQVIFPDAKDKIEEQIAKGFCLPSNVSYRPHFKRYSSFNALEQRDENSLDFRVHTGLGQRWLELCEFAPLSHFGGSHELVPEKWDANRMIELFLELIEKKDRRSGDDDVILVIYKTHSTLFVPPPIIRGARAVLLDRKQEHKPKFDSIYFVSPHSSSEMSVWEVWPGDPDDQGPVLSNGKITIGI